MTLVAVPIMVDAEDLAEATVQAERAHAGGADLIEWRFDALAAHPDGPAMAQRLVHECPRPCIVTCRSPEEGGLDASEDDAERLALLAACAMLRPAPRFVDIELATWQRCPDEARAVLAAGDDDGPGLILSSHDFAGRPADLLQRIEAMMHEPECRVIKVAWTARSLRDGLEAFDLLAERRKPAILLCMGPFGVPTRLLAAKFGGFLTYVALDDDETTAPGQVTLAEWRELYRAPRVGRGTRVYGIAGWPVAHSRGPEVHNAAFEAAGHDGVYVQLPIAPGFEPFKATIGALVDHPALDFAGASVTLPHKEDLVRFVRERGGTIEPLTERIGAANTLVVGPGPGAHEPVLHCLNTDAPAARAALEAVTALGGRRVVVLGAGGAARAVAAAVQDAGASVTVVARTRERAERLAADLAAPGLEPVVVADAPPADAEIIVNATPVGMVGGPDPEGMPLPPGYAIDAGMVVLDTVYAPDRTPLVRAAEAAGARVVLGSAMFERQGTLQRAAWLEPAIAGR